MKEFLLASATTIAINPDLVYPVVVAVIIAGALNKAHRRKEYA